MCLLIFHLILSGITFNGVDINMAQKVLDWNLGRYPNGMFFRPQAALPCGQPPTIGVFFLFAQGRMSLVRSQPAKAIEYYEKAAAAQQQYRNLHLISFWEIAVANLALWDIQKSLDRWTTLKAEATVSRFRSQIRQPVYVTTVVESDLRFWRGNLHVTPLWGREKGGDSQVVCGCSKAKTADRGQIYPTRGQLVASSNGPCVDRGSP